MIVGETRLLTREETSDTEFTAENGLLTILKPDGSSDASPEVTITPGATASTTQLLSATYIEDIGGRYRARWEFDAAGQHFVRIDTYFAYWTDVYGWVRQVLQTVEEQVPNQEIDREFASMVRTLNDSYPTLQAYSMLDVDDQDRFDEAVALLVGLRLRAYKPPTNPTGDITSWKIENDVITVKPFENTRVTGGRLDQLYERALLALGRVTAIQQFYAALAADWRLFHVYGPSRKAKHEAYESLMGIVARLLTDDANFGSGVVSLNS